METTDTDTSKTTPQNTASPRDVACLSPAALPTTRATDATDVEEGRAAYGPGGFHPVYVGDVFSEKYQVLSKIGYGVHSTMWLVKDLSKPEDDPQRFRALKVLSAMCYGTDKPIFEREILRHLGDGNRGLAGRRYICHLVDDFEHQGPNGTHVCLVFEIMGETLRSFGAWLKDDMIPYSIMRRFAIQLILALDYAHEEKVIHTDIQPANIFVSSASELPKQDRSEEQYTPIPSYPLRAYYFSGDDWKNFHEFDIALGDWGVASWADKHLCEVIQPVALRAPEVLIRAPWDAKTDWWNLGAVIYEVYRCFRMFDGRCPPDGHYELKQHLAEIVDIFGPFPKALLEKGDPVLVKEMFDDEGKVREPIPVPLDRPALSSEDCMPGLSEEHRNRFDIFLRLMMSLNPDERPTPEELLRHPWLDALK